MTNDLGDAVLTLTTDTRPAMSGMDDVHSRVNRLGDQFEEANKRLAFTQLAVSAEVAVDGVSRLSGGMSNLFDRMGDVIFNMAYIRGESMTIDAVFGDAAETIFAFGDTSARSVGLSAKAFNELIAPVGNLFTNLTALNDQEVAQWSVDLAHRAADLSFAFNKTVPESLNALQSALRGEVEPARALGISFTADTVATKALALGLADTKEELTEGDKIIARYNLVMEQSARFTNLFSDNTNNAFVQLAVFKAEQAETAGRLGKDLLPAYVRMLDLFNSTPPSVQLATFAIKEFAPPILEMASGLGLAVIGLAGLAAPVLALLPILLPLAGIIAALGAAFFLFHDQIIPLLKDLPAAAMVAKDWLVDTLVPAFSEVRDNLGRLQSAFQEGLKGGDLVIKLEGAQLAMYNLGTFIRTTLLPALGDLKGDLGELGHYFELGFQGGDAGGNIGALNKAALEIGQTLHDTVLPALADFMGQGRDALHYLQLGLAGGDAGGDIGALNKAALELGQKLRDDVIPTLQDWADKFGKYVIPSIGNAAIKIGEFGTDASKLADDYIRNKVIPALQDLTNKFNDDLRPAIVGTSDDIRGKLGPAFDELVEKTNNDVIPALANLGEAWLNAQKFVLGFVWDALQPIVQPILDIMQTILGIFEDNWDNIKRVFGTAWEVIKDTVQLGTEFVRDIISIAMALLRGDWEGAWDGIKTLLKNVWDNMWNLIQDDLELIKDLIATAWGLVWSTTKEAFGNVYDAVTGAFWDIVHFIEGLGGAGSALWNAAFNAGVAVWNAIVSGVGNLWDLAGNLIGDLIGGFKDKFHLDALQGAIEYVAGLIPKWIRDLLDSRSPSRVMYQIGVDVVQGLADGIRKVGPGLVEKAWDKVSGILGIGVDKLKSLGDRALNLGGDIIGGIRNLFSGGGGNALPTAISLGAERWRNLVAEFFPADQVNNALAIISRESGGNAEIISPPNFDGSRDVGLFQINDVHGYSIAQRQDPVMNTAIAANLWRLYGWQPWSTAPGLGLIGFEQGTSYVPADMMAFLHQGEAVLSAADNTAIRAELSRIRSDISALNDWMILSAATNGARGYYTLAAQFSDLTRQEYDLMGFLKENLGGLADQLAVWSDEVPLSDINEQYRRLIDDTDAWSALYAQALLEGNDQLAAEALNAIHILEHNGDEINNALLNMGYVFNAVTQQWSELGDQFVFSAEKFAIAMDISRRIAENQTTIPVLGYAQGTSFVPQTGLALLHKGEAVLTAAENAANRRGVTVINNIAGSILSERDLLGVIRTGLRNGSLDLRGVA